jgi:hypothetical protein
MPFQAQRVDPAGSAFARLGAELRARRQAAGDSQVGLSRKISYSADLIRRVELTERFPTREFIEACDRALGAEGALVELWPAAQEERSGAGATVETPASQSIARFDPSRSDTAITQWIRLAASEVPQQSESGGLWVSGHEIAVAASTLHMFRELDHAHGAGAFAGHLRTYIDTELVELLSRPASDISTATDRGRVAAGFLELAGYQAVDSGRPGWAQSYYARALDVTSRTGDRGYGAYLVAANLAHLALHCGRPDTALDWATRSIASASTAASPGTRAAMTAVAARAHARLGDEKATTAMLCEAERLLDLSSPADEPVWISYFNRAYLADEMAHAFHDLGRPPAARREVTDALDGVGQTHVRRLAIDAALLASTWLRSGDIEQACAVGRDAVRYAARTRSGRCIERIAALAADFRPYVRLQAVAEFHEFVHTVLPAASQVNVTPRL